VQVYPDVVSIETVHPPPNSEKVKAVAGNVVRAHRHLLSSAP
jgi:hypothetical protein